MCSNIPQNGTSKDDGVEAMVVRSDGTIVLGGYTGGLWSGSDSDGTEFAIVALSDDGEELWRWQVTGETTYILPQPKTI